MDHAIPSLKTNTVLNALLKVSSILFPLVTFPYVSRILLPEGTGKVAFANAFISYFTLLSQLGISTYGIRACAKVRDNREELNRTAQELLIINLVLSVLAYALFLAVIIFIPQFREEKKLYLVVSLTIPFTALGMEWLYQGLEQYRYITVRSLVFKLIALVSTFLLIHRQSDYILYGGLTIFAASASNILNFFHARKYISLRPVYGYHFLRHLKITIIFFAMACATTIYTHIDSTMLGVIVNDEAVGYYDAALKVRTALLGVVTSIGAVMLPRSSYYVQHGRQQEFMRISTKATHFIFLLAAPLTVFFILFAQPSIYLLSGEAYHDSILPMQVILPTILLVGVTNIWGLQMLVPLGREKVVLFSEIAGAVIDLIINAILIPRMGACGAAIGTLAAEAVVLFVQLAGLKGSARETLHGIPYGRLIAALLLAAAASCWIRTLHWGNFATLFLAACLFFGIYGLFLLLAKEPLVLALWGEGKSLLVRIFARNCGRQE